MFNKKIAIRIYLLLLPILIVQYSHGSTLMGKISDVTNQPIPYVSIVVLETNSGTVTDLYGNYSINFSPGKYHLTFKLIGYKTEEKEIEISTLNSVLNVTLVSSSYTLNETVVYANSMGLEFNTNKFLAVSQLYSDLSYYRYFENLNSNGRDLKLLNALLNYSRKCKTYKEFVNGLNDLFKYDSKTKFSFVKFANSTFNYLGRYKYIEHVGPGKTSSRYTLKDERKSKIIDTLLSKPYVLNVKQIGDSIYFICPGLYNEIEITNESLESIDQFIDAYYRPYYREPDYVAQSDHYKEISELVASKNERLASLIMFESQIVNFYPYYYDTLLLKSRFKQCLMISDTSSVLSDTFNIDSFYNLLSYLQNVIPDNHIKIFTNIDVHNNSPFVAYNLQYSNLPLTLFINNNRVYIEGTSNSKFYNLIGSQIMKVNDKDIAEYMEERSHYISYSSVLSKEIKLESFLFQSVRVKKKFNLELKKTNNSIESITLESDFVDSHILSNNKNWIYYIDEERTKLYIDINDPEFSSKKALKTIQKNKNIERVVFDVLIYPNYNALALISHFSNKDLESPLFVTNLTSNLFGSISRKEVIETWVQKHKEPKINIPCFFLVRGTYSWGETFLDMIKSNNIGKLIGEDSGGTNGDAIYNNLPIYGYMYSSKKVINRSNNLPSNETVIKPDIYFNKNESNYLNYKNDLIKYASTIPIPEN